MRLLFLTIFGLLASPHPSKISSAPEHTAHEHRVTEALAPKCCRPSITWETTWQLEPAADVVHYFAETGEGEEGDKSPVRGAPLSLPRRNVLKRTTRRMHFWRNACGCIYTCIYAHLRGSLKTFWGCCTADTSWMAAILFLDCISQSWFHLSGFLKSTHHVFIAWSGLENQFYYLSLQSVSEPAFWIIYF